VRSRRISKPLPIEHDASYAGYVAHVPGDDAWPELAGQTDEARARFGALPAARLLHRYAPGKWSVLGVLGHLCDNERVFAYRALRLARGDETPLANFEEDLYVPMGRFDERPVEDVLEEWRTVRAATLSLFASFDEAALSRSGPARGLRVSVRALCWITAGHVRHHFDVLRDRYGV
jgi:hypothetical protein